MSTDTPVLRLDSHATAAWEAAATRLREGGLVVVPTETVYGIAACVARPEAVARLRVIKGRPEAPFSVAVPALAALADELRPPPRTALRIAARWWPGPITQVLARRAGGTLGVRVPAHDALRATIAALPAPIVLPSANPPGAPAPRTVEALDPAILEAVDLVLDGGPTPLGEASTVVEPAPDWIRILRSGVLAHADIAAHAAPRWLLVCTGNTCRSPMAEVILRAELRAAAARRPDLVLPVVASGGVSASEGLPATPHAIEAIHRLGLALHAHRTSALTLARLEDSDRILCLSDSHVATLVAWAPQLATRIELLDPGGEPVEDPFGSPVERYVAVAARLTALARRRVAALLDAAARPSPPEPSP